MWWQRDLSAPGKSEMLSRDRAEARRLIGWSQNIEERLALYAELLLRWQRMINLIAPSTVATLWTRHMADSAQIVQIPPIKRTWVDLGSGAGFPGLVVAIMLHETGGTTVHLIESDKRKAAFLREVSRETGVKVTIHDRRIEEVLPQFNEAIDVISARALSPLPDLLRLSRDFLLKGGVGIFLKGQDVVDELTQITSDCRLTVDLVPSKTEPRARIVVVKKAMAG